jgi:hypothetical protein
MSNADPEFMFLRNILQDTEANIGTCTVLVSRLASYGRCFLFSSLKVMLIVWVDAAWSVVLETDFLQRLPQTMGNTDTVLKSMREHPIYGQLAASPVIDSPDIC